MSLRTLTIQIILFVAINVSAQTTEQWTAWGDAAMEHGEFYGASRFYDEALRNDPGRLVLQWKQAEACRLSHQYARAAENYERVYRKDQGRTYPGALRWLAEMQMCQGLYDEAATTWKKLMQRERKKDPGAIARAANGLLGCDLARNDTVDTTSIVVERLPAPVNTAVSEFSPRISADGELFFASLKGTINEDGELQDTADYRTRIHRSTISEGTWSDPIEEAGTVNSAGDNANMTWNSSGDRIYFTRCVDGSPCRIHFLRPGSPEMTAHPLPGLGTGMSTQPQVVRWEDREMLLFVTDREGSRGGTDIWQAELIGDSAVSLMPLSAKVNSIGNERTPWFDPVRNELYFSSDHLPGLGGYDIFISKWTNDEFHDATNAGKPVNSAVNDLYPSIDPQRRYFWFSSDRAGALGAEATACCSDIYRYPIAPAPIAGNSDPTVDTVSITTRSSYVRAIDAIRDRFPVTLYFHNDDPDPRSRAQRTDGTYEEAFQRYRALLPDYAANDPQGLSTTFFEEHVVAGRDLLNDLIAAIIPALENGDQIVLSIRGFASPLARNDYNRNLSRRRISSLENHMRTVFDGRLSAYLNGTSSSGGSLKLEELPFGEELSAAVSDDLNDLARSVYSVEAMRERRVEIEEVKITSSMVLDEKIQIIENVGELRQDIPRSFTFTLKNDSDKPLRLVSYEADCGCTTTELPSGPIPPNESTEVVIDLNGRAPLGPIQRSVTINTDGKPASYRLTIEGKIVQ